MRVSAVFFLLGTNVALAAESPTAMPAVTVRSWHVANQAPVGTYGMPLSVLRYEPRVDIQARNLAEAQADVTIRGGIFETVGFQVGAVSLFDPQTGHYLAELPIDPLMLGTPEVHTGAKLAAQGTNATSGAIHYGWRPVRAGGALALGAGEYGLRRADFHQGFVGAGKIGGARVAADVNVARSRADGSIALGDHEFNRVNGRIQLQGETTQTDVFAGYQAKFFGWPNLYTPFNSPESENLQTVLFALNHRREFGAGEFLEIGAYHRRNKDDYAFNRFAPVGAVHPFQHTTRVNGAAVAARREGEAVVWNVRGEVLADRLASTSLTAGRYSSRTIAKLALLPEKTWALAGGDRLKLLAGITYDDASHSRGVVSPVAELARETDAGPLRRLHVGYARTTQVPSYTALNSSTTAGLFRGNPDLGRETAENIEVGLESLLGGWTTQAALFWRRDEALVDWTFRRGVTARSANAVDVDTTGLELVARRTWRNVDVVLGYAGLAKDASYRGAIVDASFYALNFAKHRLTAALTWRIASSLELRWDNVARIQEKNVLRVTGGDDAVFTSIGLSYRPAALPNMELTAQVDNVWDSEFQEVPAVPAGRRQASAGIGYTW